MLRASRTDQLNGLLLAFYKRLTKGEKTMYLHRLVLTHMPSMLVRSVSSITLKINKKQIIVAVVLVSLSIALSWATTRKNKPMPTITFQGLASDGIHVTAAYPDQSWQEVILTNSGNHHVAALVILYQLTVNDGYTILVRDVICDPHVNMESDPAKLKELLSQYPVIPPHTRWLAGAGVDRIRVGKQIPDFESARTLVGQQFPFEMNALKSVRISIDGALLDTGQFIGPQTDNPKQWILDVVKKLNEEVS